MSRLRVAAIVEGHGETASLRTLLQRIWCDLLGGEFIEVLPPIRQSRDLLINKSEALERAVHLAAAKLDNPGLPPEPELILILLDANGDRPCELGPRLQEAARHCREDKDIVCVIACVEYETWFVAAARSLAEFLELEPGEPPDDPEGQRLGKGWIRRRFKKPKYSETVDQPKLTARIDLAQARQHAPSFDKLCRELQQRRRPQPRAE